jgi:hypothetical protein
MQRLDINSVWQNVKSCVTRRHWLFLGVLLAILLLGCAQTPPPRLSCPIASVLIPLCAIEGAEMLPASHRYCVQGWIESVDQQQRQLKAVSGF